MKQKLYMYTVYTHTHTHAFDTYHQISLHEDWLIFDQTTRCPSTRLQVHVVQVCLFTRPAKKGDTCTDLFLDMPLAGFHATSHVFPGFSSAPCRLAPLSAATGLMKGKCLGYSETTCAGAGDMSFIVILHLCHHQQSTRLPPPTCCKNLALGNWVSCVYMYIYIYLCVCVPDAHMFRCKGVRRHINASISTCGSSWIFRILWSVTLESPTVMMRTETEQQCGLHVYLLHDGLGISSTKVGFDEQNSGFKRKGGLSTYVAQYVGYKQ